MLTERVALAAFVDERLRARDPIVRAFFAHEAPRIAAASAAIAERLARGGRVFAFGRDAYATDAAHLSVEFVHPVIVGKRAIPALDVSTAFDAQLAALATPDDVAVGFGPPECDTRVLAALARARARGVLTLALPGGAADFAFTAPSADPHVHQELFEILGHTLYESVHVFLEHERRGADAGAAAFLYPFLGTSTDASPSSFADAASVARSIVAKAADGERLRGLLARRDAATIAAAGTALARSVERGARVLAFGNGGSATDATDFALDCVMPGSGIQPIPAHSLATEPAILTAVGNDVGHDLVFVRQLIAHGRRGDVAVAFSTSGGSKNVLAALVEARARAMATIAFLGYDGGEIVRRGLADYAIVVESADIPRIQETQAAAYHVLRECVERSRA